MVLAANNMVSHECHVRRHGEVVVEMVHSLDGPLNQSCHVEVALATFSNGPAGRTIFSSMAGDAVTAAAVRQSVDEGRDDRIGGRPGRRSVLICVSRRRVCSYPRNLFPVYVSRRASANQ